MRCGSGSTGVYGWRKRCLYAILLLLFVVVLGNLCATLLLINTIHFNFDGLGELAVTGEGVQLRSGGVSYVYDSLVTPRLASQPRRPLSFAGFRNLSAVLRDSAGLPMQSLDFYSTSFVPNMAAVSAKASRFSIVDLRGRTLFSASPGRVTVGTDVLKTVKGGVQFSGSVQTSTVRSSNSSAELLLESATRRLRVTSPATVVLDSRTSDLSVNCLTDLRLDSAAGQIKMKAPGVYIPHLESFNSTPGYSSRHFVKSVPPKSYQICMCTNGKLFVSRPDGDCTVDYDGLQCR